MSDSSQTRASGLRRCLAWGVHFYTALGLVAAAAMAVLIVDGSAQALSWAFVAMFVATAIDATDGTLARMIHIKEVLPGFDGRRLDDIVDFQTYTSLPLLLLWRAGVVPAGYEWCLLVPLLASAYGFCQVKAKTDDGYFLGFPSYWNLVAFYLYVLHPAGPVSVAILIGLAALTFVPLRYLYPSQGGKLNLVTNILGAVWALMLVVIFFRLPQSMPVADSTRALTVASLFFPAFYMAASWLVSFKVWRSGRRALS